MVIHEAKRTGRWDEGILGKASRDVCFTTRFPSSSSLSLFRVAYPASCSSFVFRRPSSLLRPLSFVSVPRLPSPVLRLPSVLRPSLPSLVFRPPSFVFRSPSPVYRRPSSILPPSSLRPPFPSPVFRPPSSALRSFFSLLRPYFRSSGSKERELSYHLSTSRNDFQFVSFIYSDLGAHGEDVIQTSIQSFIGSATSGPAMTSLHTVSPLFLNAERSTSFRRRLLTLTLSHPSSKSTFSQSLKRNA